MVARLTYLQNENLLEKYIGNINDSQMREKIARTVSSPLLEQMFARPC